MTPPRAPLLLTLSLLPLAWACKDSRDDASSSSSEASARSGPTEPTKVDQPEHSSDGAVAGIGTHLYWMGGTTGSPSKIARRFDVKTKTWEALPSADVARLQAGAAAVGDAVLVAGGMSSITGRTDAIEIYDTKGHTWRTATPMPEPLGEVAMTALGERAYVFGGEKVLDKSMSNFDSTSVHTAISITGDGKTMKVLAPMPTAREAGAAVAVDDAIWVLGGRITKSGSDEAISPKTDVVEIYDPAANAWSDGPSLPRAAAGDAVYVDGTLVFFGEDLLSPQAPMILDVKGGAWTMGESRNDETIGAVIDGAAVLDGTIYVLSTVVHGFSDPSEPHVSTYDPKADTWTVLY